MRQPRRRARVSFSVKSAFESAAGVMGWASVNDRERRCEVGELVEVDGEWVFGVGDEVCVASDLQHASSVGLAVESCRAGGVQLDRGVAADGVFGSLYAGSLGGAGDHAPDVE